MSVGAAVKLFKDMCVILGSVIFRSVLVIRHNWTLKLCRMYQECILECAVSNQSGEIKPFGQSAEMMATDGETQLSERHSTRVLGFKPSLVVKPLICVKKAGGLMGWNKDSH